MTEKKFYLTKEGLNKLKSEYQELQKIAKTKIQEKIPELYHSEELNPEYLVYQEDVDLRRARIAELEKIFKNTELIKTPPKSKQNFVNLGAKVTVEINDEIDEFTILGTLEANPVEKIISNESPIGQVLLGKRVGETVIIKTPIVNRICKIIKIKYQIEK